MTNLTAEQIAGIKAATEKATPGPWRECGHDRGGCSCGHVYGENIIVAVAQHASLDPGDPEHLELTTHSDKEQRSNARFIANCDPQTISALCDLALRGLTSLPDTEDDVNAAKDEGADYVLDGLAKALGLKQWVNKDGSESWDGDVSATLMSVLYDAKVLDPETNDRLASLPEGYALVPIEPTEAMIDVGGRAHNAAIGCSGDYDDCVFCSKYKDHRAPLGDSCADGAAAAYRAMLAASPAIPTARDGGDGTTDILKAIAAFKGKTLISVEHGQPYSIGAHDAFEQAADLARAALSKGPAA